MQKILNFIERNELEIKLSFYLMIINVAWLPFVINLFSGSTFSDNVSNYSLWIPSIIFILYIIIKKVNSSEFLLFPPIRFVFFYFLFQALFGNLLFINNDAILNRQRYHNFDEFIIESFDQDKEEKKVTFIEKFYKKLFK